MSRERGQLSACSPRQRPSGHACGPCPTPTSARAPQGSGARAHRSRCVNPTQLSGARDTPSPGPDDPGPGRREEPSQVSGLRIRAKQHTTGTGRRERTGVLLSQWGNIFLHVLCVLTLQNKPTNSEMSLAILCPGERVCGALSPCSPLGEPSPRGQAPRLHWPPSPLWQRRSSFLPSVSVSRCSLGSTPGRGLAAEHASCLQQVTAPHCPE